MKVAAYYICRRRGRFANRPPVGHVLHRCTPPYSHSHTWSSSQRGLLHCFWQRKRLPGKHAPWRPKSNIDLLLCQPPALKLMEVAGVKRQTRFRQGFADRSEFRGKAFKLSQWTRLAWVPGFLTGVAPPNRSFS